MATDTVHWIILIFVILTFLCVLFGTFRGYGAARMIVLGLILLVVGIVTGISILTTIGIILLIVGAVLFLLGSTGHAVGGRNHWY